MRKILIIAAALLLIINQDYRAQKLLNNGKGYYLSGSIVFKIKDSSQRENKLAEITRALEPFGAAHVAPFFENNGRAAKEKLKDIYTAQFSSVYDPLIVAQRLIKNGNVLWAEPKFVHTVDYVPNDTQYNSQWSLQAINAEAAWDITKGDSSIIIGIIDTGVDWNHPDLSANIWRNSEEANGTAGVDDDNNGYVDDIIGWDFGGLNGNPDNNPMEDRPDHGTHVAGCAAAVTDNSRGVASIGYNSTIMAVKTSRDDVRGDNNAALIYYGYEGIIYAAENGAKIINCSWGGYNYSILGQEVIDYVTNDLGCLVVAATGNENKRDTFYPAAYDNVLSVGATNSSDQKAYFSNHGDWIDIVAPGVSILNTWQNDTYASLNGTSMASPITAGLCALTAAQFPGYTGFQVGEQVRVNADNIYNINPNYLFLLGRGRINALAALTNENSVSVRMTDHTFIDLGDGDGSFEPGETVEMRVEWTNILNPVSSLNINAVAQDATVEFTSGSYSAGSASQLETFNNFNNPFLFTISEDAPKDYTIRIRLEYNDGAYSDFEWLTIRINPSFAVHDENDLEVTISSDGNIGFNDYPDNQGGTGFRFDEGPNLLFEGGLIYGTSEESIANAVRGVGNNNADQDFTPIVPFTIEIPGELADAQGFARFSDNSLGIETSLHSFQYAPIPFNKFLILKYVFRNTTGQEINNFYAGLFFDWDIDEETYDDNLVRYNADNNFGYAYNQDRQAIDTYVASAVLGEGETNFYGINNGGGGGSFSIYDGYSDAEKFTSISSGLTQTNAGPSDISFAIGAGPYDIPAQGSLAVGFVLAADSLFEGLINSISESRTVYESLIVPVGEEVVSAAPEKFELGVNYPNPFNPSTTINFSVPERSFVTIKVYDILGSEVAELVNEEMAAGNYNARFDGSGLTSGVYIYTMRAGNFTASKKFTLMK